MQLNVNIKLKGLAFDVGQGAEVADILRRLADRIDGLEGDCVKEFSTTVHDSQGRPVCTAGVA